MIQKTMLRVLACVWCHCGFWLSHSIRGFQASRPVLAFPETGNCLRLSHRIPKSYAGPISSHKAERNKVKSRVKLWPHLLIQAQNRRST